MGACYAQIKGFTLGFAPISGMWIKVFVKAQPNTVTSLINSCLAVSLHDNICISNAQYYGSGAQQNLWCVILEF